MPIRRMFSAVLVTLAVACIAAHAAPCTPSFPLESGSRLSWQGADDAYSVPLPDGRDIWIFGDTLYGPRRFVQGHDPRQTHSSLGISTCGLDGRWNLQYVIKHDAAGNAESFFVPKNATHWYWAMDGFVVNKDLWITLMCIRHASSPQPWAMDFESCGSDLARVSHLERDPQHWQVDYFPLVADGVKAYPSASAVVLGKYVYIFAMHEDEQRALLATRIPLQAFKGRSPNPQAAIEYLAADNTWKQGFDPAKAKAVMARGATELSIRYHADLKKWLAVLVAPEGFSDRIILRQAPDLLGPWSEGETIYHIPEMQPAVHDKDTFCYAGKEHPELEAAGRLLFTYVCNTMDVPKLATDLKIYFPRAVDVAVPGDAVQ